MNGVPSRLGISFLRDRIIASDPALVRLYMGARAAASVGVALAIMLALRRFFHFELSAALIGVPLGIIANIAVNDATHRDQKLTTLLLAAPAMLTIVVVTAISSDRFLCEGLFVGVLFAAMYIRKYGARTAALGVGLFIGFFFALIFGIPLQGLPWGFLSSAITVLCTYGFRFYVFRDLPELAVHNATAAFRARQRLIRSAIRIALSRGKKGGRLRRTLEHNLLRLNETALTLHDLLATPDDHLYVLEAELSTADAVERVAAGGTALPDVRILQIAQDAEVNHDWTPRAPFRVGAQLDTARMPLAVRQAIQLGAAGVLATLIGELVSPERWYWAVLTAFFVFLGTSSSGEVRYRAWGRSIGTAIGIVIGILLSYPLRGHEHAALSALIVFVFLTVYSVRLSYAAFTVFITIGIAILYELLGLLTDELLVMRLTETAVGAILGGTAAALLLPISTKRVLFNVTVEALKRLDDAVKTAVSFLSGDTSADPVQAARKFDEAVQSARVQLEPLLAPGGGVPGAIYRTRLILMLACGYYMRELASLAYQRPEACAIAALSDQRDAIDADIRAILSYNEGAAELHLPHLMPSESADAKASCYLIEIDRTLHGLARTLG